MKDPKMAKSKLDTDMDDYFKAKPAPAPEVAVAAADGEPAAEK